MESFMFPLSAFQILLSILTVYIIYTLLRFGHREKHLPPGPPTIPILGNAHQIPAKNLYRKFKQWSDEYGPIFSLKIGKGTIIVLNDRRTVHELVDKRSAIYSDRPLDYNVDVALGKENFSFMHTTSLWRAQRKIASQILAPKVLDDKVMDVQEAEFCQLMYDLLETPEQFEAHVKRTAASMASIILYGFRAPTADDFWATCVYRSMKLLSASLAPGSYLPIDQFPILKLIPDRWAPSKQLAKRTFVNSTAIWTEARNRVEQRRSSGDHRISLCDRLLGGDVKPDVPLTNSQLTNFIGSTNQGAADTTMSAMLTILLHMAKYPWAQEKAQKELDKLCGTERMPVWGNFKDLPYINCIMKECMRIRPITTTGIPHRAAEDNWFDGMLIPKDATVFIPPSTLHQDMHSDPETFNPDRYLDHPKLAMDYAASSDFMNRDHYAYGAGRRICVGIHLAERTQWRFVARVLWAFRIEPGVDEMGKTVELDTDAYTDGLARQPKAFKLKIEPRSEKHAEVVRRDLGHVKEYLRKWE